MSNARVSYRASSQPRLDRVIARIKREKTIVPAPAFAEVVHGPAHRLLAREAEGDALAKGMEAKAVEFVKKGAEIYSKA